jgi:hypothetical protein
VNQQTEPMDKARLLALMQSEFEALEAVLTTLDEARRTQPGVYGELSVKDVLAHIAAWQGLEVGWLRASLRGAPVVRYARDFEVRETNGEAVTDQLNAHIVAENRDKSWDEVLDDLQATHTGLMEIVATMSNEDLNDPHRFPWWDGESIWTSIAGNSYEHVREHRALIESWLAGGKPRTDEQE